MAAVIVIGIIGFLLDRVMLQLQRVVSWDKSNIT
jgi:nitrate/nitrite transport system permease protein